MPEIYRPMMEGVSVKTPYCAVCGRTAPLNQHHIVKRSAGKLFKNGREMRKPTITLCGFGNAMTDADGRLYCHGLAHMEMLHFRWVKHEIETRTAYGTLYVPGGHWEWLRTEEPTKYEVALTMDGWQRLPEFNEW